MGGGGGGGETIQAAPGVLQGGHQVVSGTLHQVQVHLGKVNCGYGPPETVQNKARVWKGLLQPSQHSGLRGFKGGFGRGRNDLEPEYN